MADYIDKQAFLDYMKRTDRYFNVKFDIENFPNADVAPVRRGRWEPGNPICPVCGGDKFKDLDADIWSDWQPDFCPNCGAKMDEKEDKHENYT